MRAWVHTDRLTGLGLTTADVINAIQSQNVQAAVGRIGARPISNDQQLQLNIQTKGRLTSPEEFEQHRHPHQSGWLDPAPQRCRPRRTRRRQHGPRDLSQRRARRGHRHLPVARRQCDHHARGGQEAHRRPATHLSRGRDLEGHLRPHHLRHGHHPRGAENPDRGFRPRGRSWCSCSSAACAPR